MDCVVWLRATGSLLEEPNKSERKSAWLSEAKEISDNATADRADKSLRFTMTSEN